MSPKFTSCVHCSETRKTKYRKTTRASDPFHHLGDLGYSEEEVDAFVDGARISSALGHRPGTRPNTAEEQDQERFLQAREFELRSFSDDWPLFPASRGMPLEWKHALHELREMSFDTFRAGMRNVAHTRQRLDEQHAKMKRLVPDFVHPSPLRHEVPRVALAIAAHKICTRKACTRYAQGAHKVQPNFVQTSTTQKVSDP